MEASKVTISKATMDAAQKPLTRKEKAALKIDKLLAFVATKENGHSFKMEELIEAMGYDPAKQYSAGWAFLKSQAKKSKRFTLEGDKLSGWSVYARSARVVKPADKPVVTETADTKVEDYDQVIFISKVREMAKDFAWQNNSDSLRDFIGSLF